MCAIHVIPSGTTVVAAPPPHPVRRLSLKKALVSALPAFTLSLIAGALCYHAAGATLGTFVGPVLLCTILCPPLVLAEQSYVRRLSSIAAVVGGTAIVWFAVALNPNISIANVLACTMVLAVWLSFLSALALLLHEFGMTAVLCAATVVVLGLAWLTWPVWLSPALAGQNRLAGELGFGHPLLAANSAVEQLGLWGTPMGGPNLTYRYLTNLNQDVAYPPHRGVWLCVALYGGASGLLWLAALWLATARRQHDEQ